ncbi:MAG: hypothetical protein Q9162_005089 [Coniocarpon cinnabarinum]
MYVTNRSQASAYYTVRNYNLVSLLGADKVVLSACVSRSNAGLIAAKDVWSSILQRDDPPGLSLVFLLICYLPRFRLAYKYCVWHFSWRLMASSGWRRGPDGWWYNDKMGAREPPNTFSDNTTPVPKTFIPAPRNGPAKGWRLFAKDELHHGERDKAGHEDGAFQDEQGNYHRPSPSHQQHYLELFHGGFLNRHHPAVLDQICKKIWPPQEPLPAYSGINLQDWTYCVRESMPRGERDRFPQGALWSEARQRTHPLTMPRVGGETSSFVDPATERLVCEALDREGRGPESHGVQIRFR